MPARALTLGALCLALLLAACVHDEPTVAASSATVSTTTASSAPPTTPSPSSTPSATTSPTPAPPPSTGIDGSWSGTWASTSGGETGAIELVWAVSGSALTGTITLEGTPCLVGGVVSGTASGSSVRFLTSQPEVQIRYRGRVGDSEIRGSYQSSCGDPTGTWSVTRSG
jgi:hypothetical protein